MAEQFDLKLDFPEAYCVLELSLVRYLKHYDLELTLGIDLVFSNSLKETLDSRLFGNLLRTLEEVSHYFWLISKNNPLYSNAAPEILKTSHEIYLLAKENSLRIGNIVSASNKGTANRAQESFIRDIKTIHAWVKHLLRLTETTQPPANPQQAADG
jgi:hypothetical protein